MKIVFVSNFLNHHQIPFCEEIIKKCDEFYFIATDKDGNQGYQTTHDSYYLIDYNADTVRAENEILSADAVIFGASADSLVELRMKENKLSFIYSERIFKKSVLRCLLPRNAKMLRQRYLNHKNKNLYVLAASAFLTYDLTRFGYPKDKIFKWGYFPECQVNTQIEKLQNSILFAGRLLDWKHAETVIETAKLLKQDGIDFKVNIVGDGPEKENLMVLKETYELEGYVEFLGSKSHDELLNIMGESGIYMFTSDFYEGWGAVLNEAMSNACAVVASSAAGSVPFLISHGENGVIYEYGDNYAAYEAVKALLKEPEKTKRIGENAKTYMDNYNYKVAAERFVSAVKEFYKDGKISPSNSGIFSEVDVIKNNWFKSGVK